MIKSKMAEKLSQLRSELGKSQEEVARDLKISTSSLVKYEAGQRTPRDEVKLKIAQYYNTSVEAIFFDVEWAKT